METKRFVDELTAGDLKEILENVPDDFIVNIMGVSDITIGVSESKECIIIDDSTIFSLYHMDED